MRVQTAKPAALVITHSLSSYSLTVQLYNKENPGRNPQRLFLLHLLQGFQVFYKKIIDSTHEKFPWKKFQNEEKM